MNIFYRPVNRRTRAAWRARRPSIAVAIAVVSAVVVLPVRADAAPPAPATASLPTGSANNDAVS